MSAYKYLLNIEHFIFRNATYECNAFGYKVHKPLSIDHVRVGDVYVIDSLSTIYNFGHILEYFLFIIKYEIRAVYHDILVNILPIPN